MSDQPTRLPDEAYRELKEGETYHPIVPASESPLEITIRSVVIGVIMAMLFSLASAYLALKTGQGMEAAIPIAIIAIGIANVFARRSTILENVIIQSIGAASSAVVAGAVFTIPALYMLDIEVTFWHIFFTAFFGGCLGVLFLIPLRDYLMVKEHGKLPFPEAMATTEILVAGESAGQQAKTLAWAALVAFVFDLCILSFTLWKEVITFHAVGVGRWIENRFAMAFRIDGLSAIIGLGYIVGIKYASIIAAGSFLSFFVLIPLVKFVGGGLEMVIPPGDVPISQMSVDDIFVNYVRLIGIGGIAGAGLMGIIKSIPSIGKSFALGIKGIAASRHEDHDDVRTERDISMRDVMIGVAAIGLCLWLFFRGGVATSLVSTVGVLLALGISFLFTLVAARAIGLIGTNPVSGMTLTTLIITSVILTRMGLSGKPGMFIALIIGGVVCTALATAGAFATDLKIGRWIGATPKNQHDAAREDLYAWFDGDACAPGIGDEGDHLRPDGSRGGSAVAALRVRSDNLCDPLDGRRTGPRLRTRHVSADPAQHSGPSGRRDRLVRQQEQQGRRCRQGTERAGYPRSLRIYRRRLDSRCRCGGIRCYRLGQVHVGLLRGLGE